MEFLPNDIIDIVKEFTIFKPKTNEELKSAAKSWCSDKEKALQEYGDISLWDTSLITSMAYLFYECSGDFNDDISKWDVSNVTNMRHMFNCDYFNQPLNGWNVSNVEDMSWMFLNCDNFNEPLDRWDVSNVIFMTGMFQGASTFNQDISMLL